MAPPGAAMHVLEEGKEGFTSWLKTVLQSFAKVDWADSTADELAEIVNLVLSEDRGSFQEHYKALEHQLADILEDDTRSFINQILRGISLRAWLQPSSASAAVAGPPQTIREPAEAASSANADIESLMLPSYGSASNTQPLQKNKTGWIAKEAKDEAVHRGLQGAHKNGIASQRPTGAQDWLPMRSPDVAVTRRDRTRSRSPTRNKESGYQRTRDYTASSAGDSRIRADGSRREDRAYNPADSVVARGGNSSRRGIAPNSRHEPYDPTKPVTGTPIASNGIPRSSGVVGDTSRRNASALERRRNNGASGLAPSFSPIPQLANGFNPGNSIPGQGFGNHPGLFTSGFAPRFDGRGASRDYSAVMFQNTWLTYPNIKPYQATLQQGWPPAMNPIGLMNALAGLQALSIQLGGLSGIMSDAEPWREERALPPRMATRAELYAAYNYRSAEVLERRARIEDAKAKITELSERRKELEEKIREGKLKLDLVQPHQEVRAALERRQEELQAEIAQLRRLMGQMQPTTASLQVDNRPKNVLIRAVPSDTFDIVKTECLSQRYQPDGIQSYPAEGHLVAHFAHHWQAVEFMRALLQRLNEGVLLSWDHKASVSATLGVDVKELREASVGVSVLGEFEDRILNMDAEENLDVAEDRDRV